MQIHPEARTCGCVLSAALAVTCALAFSACGGGGSSKSKSVATAATGASGATGTTGTTGGAAAPKGGSTGSGGAAAPKTKSKTQASKPQNTSAGGGGGSASPQSPGATQQGGKKKSSSGPQKNGSKPKKVAPNPTANYTGQQLELYREAKIVCATLTLDGLAHEYGVKRTPEAVARAYSHTYDVTLRGAVYEGCKAGVTK